MLVLEVSDGFPRVLTVNAIYSCGTKIVSLRIQKLLNFLDFCAPGVYR